jgi:chemotaxis protein histidine kinase CheA
MAMSSTSAEKVYSPRNRIADVASPDGGPDLETILARVKAGIEELAQEYLGEAQNELAELSVCVNLAQTSAGAEQSAAINRIFRISHDLRGVAGSFDYPLMTQIGSSLCSMIEKTDTFGPLEIAVIDLHVGAMQTIMSNRMTGDGDAKAREMISGIDAVVRKYAEKPPDR